MLDRTGNVDKYKTRKETKYRFPCVLAQIRTAYEIDQLILKDKFYCHLHIQSVIYNFKHY